ncbi:alpha/beta fold hydrolase [Aeromicrobium ginsengisoli]|uniref:Alpha/beta fold hydrolase n=1 Tax=Aeromicrobium ginsengisoli TaxID=363867 RepID=A0A5M4FDW2_9ACTN|nr:alpha/beta fold hydrolase [Aeromicrobium ginsengisoli]KAA1397442.1 alpha/beta fold hydrolase [Aeromicrobium ginsengisoli]
MTAETISSSDVLLHVRVRGNDRGPTVVLVHGFPDNQHVWDHVAALLAPDHRVVTYDVRGAGGSTAPASRSGYRMSKLVGDLAAVIDHVRPDGGPVHLVGHDWGSIQSWAAVMRESSDARLTGRIASYTSISGPGLEIYGNFFRDGLARRRFAAVGRQAIQSWYVVAFQMPRLPELATRRFSRQLRKALARGQRIGDGHWGETFEDDFRNGLNLYRANGLSFRRDSTSVPVQLVVPTKDTFLTPAVYADVAAYAPDVRRVDVVAGHWVVQSQPGVVADAVRAFVTEIEARQDVRREA